MTKSILVTGASSGIGAGVVEVLSQAGLTVHAVARRKDRLAALAEKAGCIVHSADLSDPAERERLADDIAPDVLVNNAGRGGGFEGIQAATAEDIAATVDLNVSATLDLCRLMLPGMVARGQGHVINIGSVAALYPCPSALYGGTKAAIKLISQNLRIELRATSVRVSDVRPGRVTSEFYDVALDGAEKSAAAKATGIRELSPRDIGDAVLFAINAPAHVNVSTIEIQPLEQTYGGTGFDPV